MKPMHRAVFAALVMLGAPALAQPPSPAPTPAPAPPKAPPAPPTRENPVTNQATGVTLPSGLYDEEADAVIQIREAHLRARKANKRTLVLWGENLCEFCVHMHNMLTQDPQIKPLLESEYEMVKVFIGRFDKHIELAQSYRTNFHDTGAPALTVIDPVSNQAIAVLGKEAVAKPMTITPLRIFDQTVVHQFLANNRPSPRIAPTVLNEDLTAAGKAGKLTLVVFGMPGCETCRELEAWLEQPAVAPILDRAFVIARIDTERMTLGQHTFKRFTGGEAALPPWVVVLRGDGKPATEADPGGRAGRPGLPRNAAEVDAFVAMLSATNDKLPAPDLDALRASLAPPPAGGDKPRP